MIPEFDLLSSDEVELMHKAPMLVCILIAGADGRIDQSEISKAISLASEKYVPGKSRLAEFYDEVGSDFEDKLKIVIQGFPLKEKERSPKVIDELRELNPILKKLDRQFSIEFYKSLKEIAMEIANSSGGVLGMKKVGQEEARYLSLDMINDPSQSWEDQVEDFLTVQLYRSASSFSCGWYSVLNSFTTLTLVYLASDPAPHLV